MPTCPRCGRHRVERFCAHCGADVRHAPPSPVTIRPMARRPKWPGMLLFIPLLGAGVLLVGLFAARSVVTPPTLMSVPSPSVPSPGASMDQASQLIATAQDKLKIYSDAVTTIEKQRADLASQIVRVSSLRQQFMVARRQALADYKWPIVVAGYRFPQVRDIDYAIDNADRYLDKATQNQSQLLHEYMELAQLHREAARIVQSMIDTQSRMSAGRSAFSLEQSDAHLKMLELNLENRLMQIQKITSPTLDLRPFSPND